MITVTDLHFSYGDRPAVRGVNLLVEPGEFLGIIGPNGAGKTTLVRLMAGFVKPTSGRVELEGRPIEEIPRRRVARMVACLPQETRMDFPYMVEEVVLLGRLPHARGLGFASAEDLAAARTAMDEAGVSHLEGRRIDELSGGERQRVRLAQAFAQGPKIMLLDEPASFLDLKHSVSVYDVLAQKRRESGLTIVTILHMTGWKLPC